LGILRIIQGYFKKTTPKDLASKFNEYGPGAIFYSYPYRKSQKVGAQPKKNYISYQSYNSFFLQTLNLKIFLVFTSNHSLQ